MTTDGEGTTEEAVIEKVDDAVAPVDDSNAKLLQMYETGMLEARQRANNLEAQLREIQTQRMPPNEPLKSMDNNEFWANSAENIAKIVDQALDKRIKPLTDFVNETKGGNKYAQIKDRLRNDPGFKDKFSDIEGYLDEVMRTTEVTEQNVNTAALSIIGAMATGRLKAPAPVEFRKAGDPSPLPQNPSTTKNDATQMPAHLRPSGPSSKPVETKKMRRPLTELEERIRREQRMTADEYLDELDNGGPMVIESILPKKKPVTPPTA